MTQQTINVGSGPDSYTGDTLRDAFIKVNSNFTELYSGNISANISGNVTVESITSTGNVTGQYFIGNGALLTGITASGSNYSNSNVASYLPTYSGNINAAYYFGNGSHLTGITATANLGNLYIDGITNQTITGNTPGSLTIKPYAGSSAVIQTEYAASGIPANLVINSSSPGTLTMQTSQVTPSHPANLVITANGVSIVFDSQNNILGFNAIPRPGYGATFHDSVYAQEFYASANFPTGYQFTTPTGDTGLSHTYQDDINGNVSVLRLRHDSEVPAKFYENNTSLLSGNLVVVQAGSEAGSFPDAFVQTYSTANTYTQFIWQNLDSNGAATGDIVITSDTGTDTSNYIDLGMTGSGYDNTNPNNSLGTSVGHSDGYLYVKGTNDGLSGNLTIGTVDAGTVTKIISGGVDAGNVVATFSEAGLMPGGNVSYDLGSSTAQWRDLWLSNSTMYLGGFPITVTANGTLQVNGSPISGNIAFDQYNIYNGQGVIISNFSFVDEAETAYVQIPAGNSASDLNVVQEQGNVRVVANTAVWNFGADNKLTAPGEVYGQYFSLRGGEASGTIGSLGYGGNIIDLYGTNGVTISTVTEGGPQWQFGTTGTLTIPGEIQGRQATVGGYANIRGGYGTAGPGGDVLIAGGSSGNGISEFGNVVVAAGSGQWTFDNTGVLTVPGEGIIKSIDDTVILQTYNTTGSFNRIARLGTDGNWYLETAGYDAWVKFQNEGTGASITVGNVASGAKGKDLTINAGASDSITWNSNSGGNVDIYGGYGSFADGGGGSGGSVNIYGGFSSDSHPGNVTIHGPNYWNFDYTGSMHLPGNTAFLYSTADAVYLNSDSTTFNSIDIVTNGDTILRNQRAVKIVADSDGSGYNWAFNANGNLTLPANNSTITYANGTSILAGLTAPTQIVNGNTSVYIPTEGGDITFQRLGTNYGHIGNGLAIGYIAGNLNQGLSAVALGTGAGTENQGYHAVAVGWNVGQYDQGAGAIAIGENPGYASQGNLAIAIGTVAGRASQGSYAIAMGVGAGYTSQTANAVAIGTRAGQYTQGQDAVAIGLFAGNSSQGGSSVALGSTAGQTSQGAGAVALGAGAGQTNQGAAAIAIGNPAGTENQGAGAIAIGTSAAQTSQGPYAIAIGTQAGAVNQGQHSIAIGTGAAGSGIQPNNSIILSATGTIWNGAESGFYVAPVRSADGANVSLSYNTSTNEITYSANTFVSNTYVPSTTSSAGTMGQITFDGNYVYICVGTNSWKRANLSTW